ncbi:MAG: hypothetical protein V3W44_02640 [Dehalococcoidales bacterium]
MRPRELFNLLKDKVNPAVYRIKHEGKSRSKRRSEAVGARRTNRYRFQAKPSPSGAAQKRARRERKRRRRQSWSRAHKA